MKIYSISMKILVILYFLAIKWVFLTRDLININLDNNFDEDYPDTIFLVRLLAWHIKVEKCKSLTKKKRKELMLISWHPRKYGRIFTCQKIKKRNRIIFYLVMLLMYIIWEY